MDAANEVTLGMHDAQRLLEIAQERWPGFEKWAVGGDIVIVLACVKSSPDGSTWVECIEPSDDGGMLPLHHHPEQAQFVRVVRGRLRVICGDREFVIRSGQSVFIPPGTPHKAWNPGPGATISHVAFSPGGNEQAYRKHGKRLEAMDAASLHAQKNLQANEELAASLAQMGMFTSCDPDDVMTQG